MSQVEVRQLVKEYKRRKNSQKLGQALRSMFAPEYEVLRAVDSVDFSIETGESVGYVGPNGSGKSTTIKMLCGILKPTEGSVRINGLNPFKDRVRNSKGIGAVFGNRSSGGTCRSSNHTGYSRSFTRYRNRDSRRIWRNLRR